VHPIEVDVVGLQSPQARFDAATIFLRWLPALFGSSGSVWLVNLVARTNRSRTVDPISD
jgi:hypothetical protein